MNDDAKKVSVTSAHYRRSINAILRKTWQADGETLHEGDHEQDAGSTAPSSGKETMTGLKKLKLGAMARANRARSSSMHRSNASAVELPTVIDNDADLTFSNKIESSTVPASHKPVGFGMTPKQTSQLLTPQESMRSERRKHKTIAGSKIDGANTGLVLTTSSKTHRLHGGSTSSPSAPRTHLDAADTIAGPSLHPTLETIFLTPTDKNVRGKGSVFSEEGDSGTVRGRTADTDRATRQSKPQPKIMLMSACYSMDVSSTHKPLCDDDYDHTDHTNELPTGTGTATGAGIGTATGATTSTATGATTSTATGATTGTATGATTGTATGTATGATTGTTTGTAAGAATGATIGTAAGAATGATTGTAAGTATGATTGTAAVVSTVAVHFADGTVASTAVGATTAAGTTSVAPITAATISTSAAASVPHDGEPLCTVNSASGRKPFRPSGAMTITLQLPAGTEGGDSMSNATADSVCTNTLLPVEVGMTHDQHASCCNCARGDHVQRKSTAIMTPAFGGASQDEIKKALALRRAKTIKAESVFETYVA